MTVLHGYTYGGGSGVLIFLIIIAGVTFVASMLAKWSVYNLPAYEKVFILLMIATIAFGVVYAIIKLPQAMETTRYKVTLEENVDLNEFLKQYRIIEMEGEILVIEQIGHGE